MHYGINGRSALVVGGSKGLTEGTNTVGGDGRPLASL